MNQTIEVGELMFPIAHQYVAKAVLMLDEAIREAQRARVLLLVAEFGGAAAFAALLGGTYRPTPDERVAGLICGENTTVVDFV